MAEQDFEALDLKKKRCGFSISSKFKRILAIASTKGERMFELEFNGSHQKGRGKFAYGGDVGGGISVSGIHVRFWFKGVVGLP